MWGGESGGQVSPSVGRTSHVRYGAGCGDIGVSKEHPDSQRTLPKEQEEVLESRSKVRYVRGWGSGEREQLGCGSRLGAGPWQPCRVLSGSQVGSSVSLFVPEEERWGWHRRRRAQSPTPRPDGVMRQALSSAPEVGVYSPLGTILLHMAHRSQACLLGSAASVHALPSTEHGNPKKLHIKGMKNLQGWAVAAW